MKKNYMLYLCLLIFGVGIITGGFILNSSIQKQEDKSIEIKREEKKDDGFEVVTLHEAKELISEGYEGILYFGYNSCPYCKEVKPIVKKLEDKTKANIRYVKLKNDDNKKLFSEQDKKDIYPYLMDYMKSRDGEYVLYAPLVVSVKDRKVVKGHLSTVDGHDASVSKMTDEQYKEVYNTIHEIFMSIL